MGIKDKQFALSLYHAHECYGHNNKGSCKKINKIRAEIEKEIKNYHNPAPYDFTHDLVDLDEFTTFKQGDFTVMHGVLTRGGAFEYLDPEDPTKKIILKKDYNNLKEVHEDLDYYVLKGTKDVGSHHADVIGFAYNFLPNDKAEVIEGDIVLLDDIQAISSISPDIAREVSIGFKDRIEGDVQIVEKIDHLAISLDNKEKGRCRTAGGKPCTVQIKKDFIDEINHDQNLIGGDPVMDTIQQKKVLNKKSLKKLEGLKGDILQEGDLFRDERGNLFKLDFDKNKNLTKTDLKQKEEKTMGKDKKKKKVKIENPNEGTSEEVMDDDLDEKIKGDPYKEEDKLKKGKDKKEDVEDVEESTIPISTVKDMIAEAVKDAVEPLKKDLEEYNKDKVEIEAKRKEDLLSELIQEPYGLPEELIKDMCYKELSVQKAIRENSADFNEFGAYSLTHEDVDTKLFDENSEPEKNDFLEVAHKKSWSWMD